MWSQNSTRFALLVGASYGVRPAIGLLDERCKNLYICPVPSEDYLSFDERSVKQAGDRGIHVSFLNKCIYILEEESHHTFPVSMKAESTRFIKMHSFHSGVWTTEKFEEGDRDPSLGLFEIRFCFAGEDRIFYVGRDVYGNPREERVLSYVPRNRRWSLLPPIVRQGCQSGSKPFISFCYASEGSLHLVVPGEYDLYSNTYDYIIQWWTRGVRHDPRCYSYALDAPNAGWEEEDCKAEIQDVFTKELTSKLRIDPSLVRYCKQDGLMALLLSYDDASERWVARERPAPASPGEQVFPQMSFRKFQLQESVTGVVPVTQLKGTGCLALGRSSALLLKDGEPQKPVNLRWRGELESRGLKIIWASAFPVDGAKQLDG